MNITYKKAERSDFKIIAALAEKIWRKHYITIITMEQIDYMLDKMYSEQSLLKQVEEGNQFTLVYVDKVPAGYISVSTTDNKKYFLHKFYVDQQEQAKGVGSKFLKYIEQSLPALETIELTVNRKNYIAINFYFKNGFVIKDVADFDIGNNYFMNDFIMIKKIK
ncbi:MAG: GCN5-related N-acetyltransferase [Bacteroidetes bacterium]|nr:GCN5-related N-acetyltransferase [Bacteroidota bacterium]